MADSDPIDVDAAPARPCFPCDHTLRVIGHRKRAAVWDACGGRCTYCGVALHPFRTFTVDHVIPRSRGGTNALENLVGACPTCNGRKGDTVGAIEGFAPVVELRAHDADTDPPAQVRTPLTEKAA
jgi:5-methylcytosine-specific restriction endonuclease McrA